MKNKPPKKQPKGAPPSQNGDEHRTLRETEYNPPLDPLNILYQDEDLLVLSKPSGLLSVPGKLPGLTDSLETRAKAAFPSALLVHRLDMDTSGIMIMAMNREAQGLLGKQFQKRKVDKIYIAKVWGVPKEREGFIDLPLRCDWDNRPRQMVCFEDGRPSQTKWSVLSDDGQFATIKLEPITGRSHQLRVHMMELGYPILGDPFYAPIAALNAAPRLLLHAHEITMYHPSGRDGERITFTDPVPF